VYSPSVSQAADTSLVI